MFWRRCDGGQFSLRFPPTGDREVAKPEPNVKQNVRIQFSQNQKLYEVDGKLNKLFDTSAGLG